MQGGATGDPLIGTRFRALRRFGEASATTEVWFAEHRTTGRKCVARILGAAQLGDAQAVARMWHEARALGRLRHPHIVNILSASMTAEGRPFLVVEYLKGQTLQEALEAGLVPIEQGLRWVEQLLSALAFAHSRGIANRALRSESLFLVETDAGRALKILRFPGTGPEAPSASPADEQDDLWAAGLILYEIVVGRRLGRRDGDMGAMPSSFVPDRSGRTFDAILARALDPNPLARFVSAEHFLDELIRLRQSFADHKRDTAPAIHEVAPPTAARPMPFAPDSRAKLVVLFLAAAILSAAGALFLGALLG